MDQLSKQQLILLALLVSFVTSLATGIVTVSLMDQAPRDVVRTIREVVDRTIEKVATQQAPVTAAVADSASDFSTIIKTVSESIVKIRGLQSDQVNGLGSIVAGSGVMLADKATISSMTDAEAVLPNGVAIPITVVQSQIDGNIVFMAPRVKITPAPIYKQISFGDSAVLGQSVFSLSGTSTLALGYGLITELSSDSTILHTSIHATHILPGSLLFDMNGKALGIYSTSLSHGDDVVFYSLKGLRSVIPVLR